MISFLDVILPALPASIVFACSPNIPKAHNSCGLTAVTTHVEVVTPPTALVGAV